MSRASGGGSPVSRATTRFERAREELEQAVREEGWQLEQGSERERWELEQHWALECSELEAGCATELGTGEMAHLAQGVEVMGSAQLGQEGDLQPGPLPEGETPPEEAP